MQIKEIGKEIHKTAVEKGWWEEERGFGEIIALCHSELSEALEEYRNDRGMYYEDSKGKPQGIAVELIDVLFRVLDYLEHENVDVEEVIQKKLQYNKGREYRHGNKKI